MSALVLKKDPETGNIVAAAIDGMELTGFRSVTQALNRNCLQATLVVEFDSVDVVEDVLEPEESEEPEPEQPVVAPMLTVVYAAGAAEGTKATITDTLGDGNHFAYKVSSEEIPTPNVGDVVADATEYSSGDDIPGVDTVTNNCVGIYELDAENKVVKFAAHVVIDGEIYVAPPEPEEAPALEVTFEAGTSTGATKATIASELGEGNHFAYKVADAEILTPNVGDVAEGTTEYTSGEDIIGVDDTTNKYLGIYELDAENKVVKFVAHTVVLDEIQA